jgi:hypothetical protein
MDDEAPGIPADPANETSEIMERYRARLVELRAETATLLAELDRQTAAGNIGALAPLEQELQSRERPSEEATARLTGQAILAGMMNTADATTYLDCTAPDADAFHVTGYSGVTGVGSNGPGLRGYSTNGDSVVGMGGQAGVRGQSGGFGVYGQSLGNSVGVYGISNDGDGVYGFSFNGRGTLGVSLNSYGVQAFSRNRSAIIAQSIAGPGVVAYTTSSADAAVVAENDSGSVGSTAVVALGHAGVGAYASGEQAALQLGRAQLSGAPTSGFHVAGELVLDANADLYLCKATGSPGSWTLVA